MEQLVLGVTLAVLLVAMVLTVDGVPDWAGRGTLILLGVLVAGALGIGVVELVSRWRLRRGDIGEDYARTWWRTSLRTVEIHLHAVSQGAQLLRRPQLAVSSFAAGILSWVAQILGIVLALMAFDIDADLIAALKATLTKLTASDASTSGIERLRNVSMTASTSPRSTRARATAARAAMPAATIASRRHESGLGGSSAAISLMVTSSRPRWRAASMIAGRASAVCARLSSPQPSASCRSRTAPGSSALTERSTMTGAPGLAVSKTPVDQAQVT
ncbi:MAG: hypothetical protein ACKOSO_05440 [Actinomycetota bacterium]